MDYRSYQMNVREYLRYGLEAALILSAVGLCFYDSAWVFLGYPAVLVFYLKEKKKLLAEKRRKALELQFRDTVQEIAAALAAGYSAENALAEAKKDLEILYSSSLDMVQELAAMQRKMDTGQTVEAVMRDFAERSGLEEAMVFAEIFEAGKRYGGDLIEMMKYTARTISETVETGRQISSVLAARRYEHKLMTGIPFAMILYLRLGSPGFLDVMYHNGIGIGIATICLCLYLGAWYFGKRLLEIEV